MQVMMGAHNLLRETDTNLGITCLSLILPMIKNE